MGFEMMARGARRGTLLRTLGGAGKAPRLDCPRASAPSRLPPLAGNLSWEGTDRSDEGRGEPMSQDAGSAKCKRAKTTKMPKNKGAGRLKCSLLLTSENDLRLTVLARLRETDRSTLLNSILDDSLRGVVVSLRGSLASESGAGQGSAETMAPEAA